MNRILMLLLYGFLFPTLLFSQDEPDAAELGDTIITDVDLFEGPDPLEMTLTLDLKRYQKEKYKEEYIPVDLILHVNDTLDVEKRVRIKSRGQFRKSHCHFAPFWLNIRKANVANVHLQDVKRMKVVTHCRGSVAYEDYVLIEYLAYRMYNILSPVSFRVRLIRMKYVDTGRKNKITEGWGFMIEPEEMLAERNDALVIKNNEVSMKLTRQDEMLRVALFQYMIGNSDYSLTGRHNVKILGLPGFGKEGYTPVPYDFDYSGLVNAYYAVPGDNLGLKSVTERYFLGPCSDEEGYLRAIEFLEDKREEILDLIHDFTYLNEKEKNRVVSYLETYYKFSNSTWFIEENLRSTCR